MTVQQPNATTSDVLKIGVPVAIGAAVAIAIGVYGRVHDPAGYSVNIAGFGSVQAVKTWLTTIAFVFALVQVGSALVMYGKIRVAVPRWIGALHRWSGRLAVLAAVPVAVHCLYALGLQSATPRVLTHSLLGSFFFGAFVTKMLLLTRRNLPGWVLPVVGGLVFAALVGLWLTSALWVFSTIGIPA